MSKTNEIAIIPSPDNFVPPPKKAELIKALAIRELERLTKLKAEQDKQIALARAEYEDSAEDDVDEHGIQTGNISDGTKYNSNSGRDKSVLESVHLTYSCPPSHKTKQLYAKWYAATSAPDRVNWLPCLADVERRVRAKLLEGGTASERVDKLLKDPKTSKALDAILVKLNK